MASSSAPFLAVLGVAQDGGYPQAGCRGACCEPAWADPALGRRVSCLGLVDPAGGNAWLFDATPDFRMQWKTLLDLEGPGRLRLAGIFLTHAHSGHYTGLLHLGREVMGAKKVPLFAMPRMRAFLETNGPWSGLLKDGNVALESLEDGRPVSLSSGLAVEPFLVPHRDEWSETVGFRIRSPGRTALFIPDIDGWEAWESRGTRPEDAIASADAAFVDGTFFDERETPVLRHGPVRHPTVAHSLRRFGLLPAEVHSRIRFIHFNHSNPLLRAGTIERGTVEAAGFRVAEEGERFDL
jgi:pyrroloquinoline quinone biosynthesis protein B